VSESEAPADDNRKQKRESKSTEGVVSKQKKQRTMEEYYTEMTSIEQTEERVTTTIVEEPATGALAADCVERHSAASQPQKEKESAPRRVTAVAVAMQTQVTAVVAAMPTNTTLKCKRKGAIEISERSSNKIQKIAVAVAILPCDVTNTNKPTAIATRICKESDVWRIDQWVGMGNVLRTPVSRGRGASDSIGMQLSITNNGLPKGKVEDNL